MKIESKSYFSLLSLCCGKSSIMEPVCKLYQRKAALIAHKSLCNYGLSFRLASFHF